LPHVSGIVAGIVDEHAASIEISGCAGCVSGKWLTGEKFPESLNQVGKKIWQ
jgi:hypothetical protein